MPKLMIPGIARTILLLAEVFVHITIAWQCFMAVLYALLGFHHVETKERVYEGFADLFQRQGAWVASMAMSLVAIAWAHGLLAQTREQKAKDEQDWWKSEVEDKIAWVLLVAIPAISYGLSNFWRGESASVGEEMEKQILFVLVGFSISAGVGLRLWRGTYMRVEEHLT